MVAETKEQEQEQEQEAGVERLYDAAHERVEQEPPTRRVSTRPRQITVMKGRPGRRRTVPANETSEEKFKRLATARTRKAIRAIAQLQNLAAPTYKFNAEQVEKIDGAVEEAMTGMRMSFHKRLSGGRRRIMYAVEAFEI